MMNIDKYSLISFAPSVAIVAACLAITVLGIRFVKREMAKDAQKAGER